MMTANLNTTWSRRSRRLRIQNVRVIPTRADSESLRENEKRSGLIARAHRVNALARGCHWQYYGCSSESAFESLASSACQSRVTVPGHWLGTLLQCQPGRGPGPGLRAAAPASEPEVYPVISTSSASSAAAPPARCPPPPWFNLPPGPAAASGPPDAAGHGPPACCAPSRSTPLSTTQYTPACRIGRFATWMHSWCTLARLPSR